MKQTYTFYTSVISPAVSKTRAEVFDSSVEAFEQKAFLKSLHLLLDSIDPQLRQKYGNSAGNEFRIPHGPIYVSIRQKKDEMIITAPLVMMSEENRIAMMRQVAGLNFNDLDLAKLNLRDNRLYFEYRCPPAFCHPRKLRHVLEEICRTGAKYDYEFQDCFDAERLAEPRFVAYPEELVDKVYEAVQQTCQECLEALKYFEPLRNFKDMRDIIDTSLLKIIYIACPQGKLLRSLQKAHRDMHRDIPLAVIVANGKQSIRKLQEKTKEEWKKSLYFTETFISDKQLSNLQNIREDYENCHKQALAFLEAGDDRSACLRILHTFYETYYHHHVQKELDEILVKALKHSSARPWKEAAPILCEALENILKSPRKILNQTPAAA